MIKGILLNIFLFAVAVNLIGCASELKRQGRLDTVIVSQVDVLKKLVELRQKETLRAKISTDPVLMEQEAILMTGLTGVIDSQETFLNVRNVNWNKRGEHVY